MNGCDSCTMCCKVLAVTGDDEKEFKPYGSWCHECNKGVGCKTYDTKPKACGTFECVWLQTQSSKNPMPLEMRPDKVHFVLVGSEKSLIAHVDPQRPEAYRQGVGGRLLDSLGQQMVVAARIGDRRVAIGPLAIDLVRRSGASL